MRVGKELLFISSQEGRVADIHKNTISGWVRKLITYCYSNSSRETATLVGTSTHAIRAMAASLVFRGGADLEQVMRACTWKSHNTFTDFYLKDISETAENLLRLGPVVAAQTIVRP